MGTHVEEDLRSVKQSWKASHAIWSKEGGEKFCHWM